MVEEEEGEEVERIDGTFHNLVRNLGVDQVMPLNHESSLGKK